MALFLLQFRTSSPHPEVLSEGDSFQFHLADRKHSLDSYYTQSIDFDSSHGLLQKYYMYISTFPVCSSHLSSLLLHKYYICISTLPLCSSYTFLPCFSYYSFDIPSPPAEPLFLGGCSVRHCTSTIPSIPLWKPWLSSRPLTSPSMITSQFLSMTSLQGITL